MSGQRNGLVRGKNADGRRVEHGVGQDVVVSGGILDLHDAPGDVLDLSRDVSDRDPIAEREVTRKRHLQATYEIRYGVLQAKGQGNAANAEGTPEHGGVVVEACLEQDGEAHDPDAHANDVGDDRTAHFATGRLVEGAVHDGHEQLREDERGDDDQNADGDDREISPVRVQVCALDSLHGVMHRIQSSPRSR